MQATGTMADREWWQARRFAVLAVLLACVPLAYPPLPPLTDALDHVGRYRTMLDGGAGPLAQWYTVQWRVVGNLGVDAVVALFGPLIGLEPTVKLAAIAIVALTVTGCLAISRVAHGRVTPYTLFALPLAYNHVFHMGFLNYTLAMALALNAFALWLWMAGSRWRPWAFIPIALTIWGAHVFGWAVLGLLAFAAEWSRRGNPVRAGLACWPLAAPLPLMLLWRAASSGATFDFLHLQSKAIALLMSFRDTWFTIDVLTLAVVVAAIVHGLRRAGSDRAAGWAAIALLAAFIALPIWLMGSALADTRAAPFVLILALLALRPGDAVKARTVALVGTAFFVVRIGVTTVSLALASHAQAREAQALDYIPYGARVVQFASPDCGNGWGMSRLEHIGGLAQARRRAFTNSQWPDIGASLLTTHYPAARPFENDPTHLLLCDGGTGLARRLAAFPRDAFDRLWLVDIPEGAPAALPGMTRLWAGGNSAVYRIDR